MSVTATSVDQLFHAFCTSLSSVAQELAKAEIPIGPKHGYDGWERTSTALFQSFIEDSVRNAQFSRDLSELSLVPFEMSVQSISGKSFIGLIKKNGARKAHVSSYKLLYSFKEIDPYHLDFSTIHTMEFSNQGKFVGEQMEALSSLYAVCHIWNGASWETLDDLKIKN